MRLVLCDDNRLLPKALAAGLETCGHQVVGTAATAADGVLAVAAHDPDVCLLNLRFVVAGRTRGGPRHVPAASAHQGAGAVRAGRPGRGDDGLQAGAVGFLHKDQAVGRAADALSVVAEGGWVIDTAPRRARREPAVALREQLLGELSAWETEVLHRIVAGQDTAQMVDEMGLAMSTVQSYVKSLLAKLGAHSRLEAAALASKWELLVTFASGRRRPRGERPLRYRLAPQIYVAGTR